MSGKRVLLAAEFLRGGATLARLSPLAEALAGLGHTVTLAVPTGLATTVPSIEAPRWTASPPPGYAALSYADLLMHGGFAAPDALRGLMAGWRVVLNEVSPDLVVADFAPSAMLAAKVAGVPIVAVGDGFSLPPVSAPFPAMRSWDPPSQDALESLERRILAVINGQLRALKHPALGGVQDLFDTVPRFLCGFPELDPYPRRGEADWYGAIFGTTVAALELDPRHPARAVAREAIERLGPSAGDIVICHAAETIAPALLAGKLLLMLPVFLEQTMTLHTLTRQGLAHGAPPTAGAATLEHALRRLLDDTATRRRVADFAQSYAGYHPEIAVSAVADEIDAMLTR